jgi:hypothetical protein
MMPANAGGRMNWKLILQLSLFGLVMGIGTVFVIPSTIEPFCWLVVFVISAYAIAQAAPDQPFVHGVLVGLANSVWVTASHVLLIHQYLPRHVREALTMRSMPLPRHPRVMMLLMGPVIGLASGIILGLFALVARRLVGPPAKSTAIPTTG